jgi:hypothetical protein
MELLSVVGYSFSKPLRVERHLRAARSPELSSTSAVALGH